MKETFYFSHDYNACMDEKIKKLLKKHGMTGYGIFWRIVEDLYNNDNSLEIDYEGIAYDLHSDAKIVQSVINDFGLFVVNDGCFGSASIERRLQARNEKSEKARQSVLYRWRKDATVTDSDTNVSDNDTNVPKIDTIKDSIVKDSIEIIEEEKKPDKPAPSKGVFIDSVITEFQLVFPDYVITIPGKEKKAAGTLLSTFKKQYPDLGGEEMLKTLRNYFERCSGIKDKYLHDNMSLSTMVSQYNAINRKLGKGLTGSLEHKNYDDKL